MANTGIYSWERGCVIEWARDVIGLSYQEIANLPSINVSTVAIWKQYRRWKNHLLQAHGVNQVDARQSLAQALSDELGFDLTDETMLTVDKILSRLWLFGFKIVELP